jgi:hypothetical protein
MWRLPDIPDGSIVLLNDCAREPQRTLFRLRARGDDIQLHVTIAPTHAHDLPRGGELEHFRWYYRLVDWQLSDPGCRQLNSIEDACPSNLPVPRPPDALLNAIYETKSAPSKKKHSDLFGVITQTVKCPPGSAGSTPSSD